MKTAMRRVLNSVLTKAKHVLVFIALWLCFSHVSFAQVAKNDSGTAFIASGSVATVDLTTFTVSAGANRCMVAFLHTSGTITNPTLVWDPTGTNQSMSAGPTATNTREIRSFYLIAPTTGNLVLRASWTTSRAVVLGAIAFSGADQSTCIEAADNLSATGSSTSCTGAITSTSDGATVAGCSASNALTNTSGTSIYTDATQTVKTGANYTLAGASNTHSWSLTSAVWAIAGVHVKAAAAATTIRGPLLGVFP